MSFEQVLAALRLAGSTAPAFRMLFEQVLTLFNEDEQAKLKAAYAEARAASDAAEGDFVDASRGD